MTTKINPPESKIVRAAKKARKEKEENRRKFFVDKCIAVGFTEKQAELLCNEFGKKADLIHFHDN